jgi:hypothetical protein
MLLTLWLLSERGHRHFDLLGAEACCEHSSTLAIGLFGANYGESLKTLQFDALGPATTELFALKSEVSHVVAVGM